LQDAQAIVDHIHTRHKDFIHKINSRPHKPQANQMLIPKKEAKALDLEDVQI